MKFSIAFLSALPLATFAAPIIGTLSQTGLDGNVLNKQLNADFAKQLVGSLQAQVQPLLQNMNSVMNILPAGSKLDSLSLDSLGLDSLNKMHALNLDSLSSMQETVEKNIGDVTTAMTGAVNTLSTLQQICPDPEDVSKLMHDMLNDVTETMGKVQQMMGNDKVVQQVTQMTGAFSQLVTGLSSMVQNFMPTFEKEIQGMTGSLPTMVMGLLSGLH